MIQNMSYVFTEQDLGILFLYNGIYYELILSLI